MSPLARQKNITGASSHQVLEDIVISKQLSPSNLNEIGVCALHSLTLPFVSSKDVGPYCYRLDLSFFSSIETQIKKFRGDELIRDGVNGVHQLSMSVESQAM